VRRGTLATDHLPHLLYLQQFSIIVLYSVNKCVLDVLHPEVIKVRINKFKPDLYLSPLVHNCITSRRHAWSNPFIPICFLKDLLKLHDAVIQSLGELANLQGLVDEHLEVGLPKKLQFAESVQIVTILHSYVVKNRGDDIFHDLDFLEAVTVQPQQPREEEHRDLMGELEHSVFIDVGSQHECQANLDDLCGVE